MGRSERYSATLGKDMLYVARAIDTARRMAAHGERVLVDSELGHGSPSGSSSGQSGRRRPACGRAWRYGIGVPAAA
ncbi:hypothetical protein ACFL6X_08310 [Candidatus Latescibacterota bacterium]